MYVELFSDHICGKLSPIFHRTSCKKNQKSYDDANDVTTRAKWSKIVLFEKNYSFFLNYILIELSKLKGDVIFIPKLNLVDFRMYNKMSPTKYDPHRYRDGRVLKYIVRFRQLQAKEIIFISKPKTFGGK